MKPKFIVLICLIGFILLIIGGFFISSYSANQQKEKDKNSVKQFIQPVNIPQQVQQPTQQPAQQPTQQPTQQTVPRSNQVNKSQPTKTKSFVAPPIHNYPVPQPPAYKPIDVSQYLNELNKPVSCSRQVCSYSPLGQKYNCHWEVYSCN